MTAEEMEIFNSAVECQAWPPQFLGGDVVSSVVVRSGQLIIVLLWCCAQADQGKAMRNPAWTIPVTLAVSLFLAALLERFVERPCRQLLRSRPRES